MVDGCGQLIRRLEQQVRLRGLHGRKSAPCKLGCSRTGRALEQMERVTPVDWRE